MQVVDDLVRLTICVLYLLFHNTLSVIKLMLLMQRNRLNAISQTKDM